MSMIICPECGGNVSSFAKACPHCGYPLKHEEKPKGEYVIKKGTPSGSRLASLLRVVAVLVWIGGLIIAITGAIYIDHNSYYRDTTRFSFGTFLTLLSPYVIYGFIVWGTGTVVDQVSATYSMIYGLVLEKKTSGSPQSDVRSNSSSTYSQSVEALDRWICPVCKHENKGYDEYCINCGEPKNGINHKSDRTKPFSGI